MATAGSAAVCSGPCMKARLRAAAAGRGDQRAGGCPHGAAPDPLRLHPWALSRHRWRVMSERLRVDGDTITLLRQPDIGDAALGRPGRRYRAGVHRRFFRPGHGRTPPASRAPARVLFSQPAEADVDATVVYGVNHQALRAEPPYRVRCVLHHQCHRAGDQRRCTSAVGIESGTITTIHSAMNDQPVLDAYHHTDLRKTRAASQSIIPVDTGLARGCRADVAGHGRTLYGPGPAGADPECVGPGSHRGDQQRYRTRRPLIAHLHDAAQTGFDGVLGYTEEPLASCDFNHDAAFQHRGCQPDPGQRQAAGEGADLVRQRVGLRQPHAGCRRATGADCDRAMCAVTRRIEVNGSD